MRYIRSWASAILLAGVSPLGSSERFIIGVRRKFQTGRKSSSGLFISFAHRGPIGGLSQCFVVNVWRQA
jgi:hypothetical protein